MREISSIRAGPSQPSSKHNFQSLVVALNSPGVMRYATRLCGSFISAASRASYPSSTTTFRALSSSLSSPSPTMSDLCTKLTTQLEEKIKQEEERYQKASQRSWDLNAALVRVEMSENNSGSSEEEVTLDKLVRETVASREMYNNIVHDDLAKEGEESKLHERAPRLANISYKLEDFARRKSFQHFLSNEELLSPNAPCFVIAEGGSGSDTQSQRNVLTDEEYLSGACIGLCHDLSKYGVTKASNAVNDKEAVPFIKKARDTVSLILEELLQFDFRNGPLRRKYDSTKYALKTLETVLYELSVAGAVGGHASLVSDESSPPVKKMKIAEDDKKQEEEDATMEEAAGEESSSAIPTKEIAALRERMDHRDKLRERLIKTCRDGQKAAKQSIFAMHRGDANKSLKLLNEVETCVKNDLLPILEEEPTLRYGSFSGVLEEYVEGKLFYTWLHGVGEEAGKDGTTVKAVGKILLPNEMPLNISTEDYLGGLCDLTGEIGRFAVARGTARDKESVKLCLDSGKSIYMTLKVMGKLPRNISKKVGMVSKSVEKMEKLLYEQSLMEMTGIKLQTAVEAAPDDAGGDDN